MIVNALKSMSSRLVKKSDAMTASIRKSVDYFTNVPTESDGV